MKFAVVRYMTVKPAPYLLGRIGILWACLAAAFALAPSITKAQPDTAPKRAGTDIDTEIGIETEPAMEERLETVVESIPAEPDEAEPAEPVSEDAVEVLDTDLIPEVEVDLGAAGSIDIEIQPDAVAPIDDIPPPHGARERSDTGVYPGPR